MPSLTPESQATLLILLPCWRCDQPRRRNYCRACDEFFFDPHVTRDETCPDDRQDPAHAGHRTY